MVLLKRTVGGLVVVIVACALALPLVTYAQSAPSEIVINYPELTDVNDALQLGIYFTVTDGTGRVVPDAQVQSARVLIDDGTTPATTVEQPNTPFYIILVLDASGSMFGAAEDMRQAAIQAINDAPEQARFAVMGFNERIDLLQEFTEDRNRAINAVGEVQPVNLAGTCLYDAAYQAIDTMKDAPPGRRAIILFTDGKDELASGDVCSRHTYDDVVQYATRRDSRVSIHTIGLSTQQQNINATELRNMASQTGGLSAIGNQQALKTLFGQIMDALKSQWLSKSLFYPMRGTHTATLTVTLQDGTVLQPEAVAFEVLRDYATPITPTVTPTPIVVNLEISAVTADVQQGLVSLEVSTRGEQIIGEYRFDFFDARTNQLLDRQIIPAPLSSPVTVSAAKLSGEIRVELRAFDRSGNPLQWPGERDQVTDKATYEFSYVLPTPTPPPPTATTIPIGAVINAIAYNPDSDVITLDLSLTGSDLMGGLQINVVDAKTNQLKAVYNAAVSESVAISGQGLVPLQDYNVQVIAQSPTGQNLARSNQQKFTYTPILTPTPTPQPTATHTATPKPIQVSIGSIGIDEATDEIVVGILTEDSDRIEFVRAATAQQPERVGRGRLCPHAAALRHDPYPAVQSATGRIHRDPARAWAERYSARRSALAEFRLPTAAHGDANAHRHADPCAHTDPHARPAAARHGRGTRQPGADVRRCVSRVRAAGGVVPAAATPQETNDGHRLPVGANRLLPDAARAGQCPGQTGEGR